MSDSATPWTAAHQASLSITNSQSLLKLMSIESVMPSSRCILCCPFLSCLQSFPALRSFPRSEFFASGGHSIGVSASALVFPMNIQDWFPLGLTGLIHYKNSRSIIHMDKEKRSRGIGRWMNPPKFGVIDTQQTSGNWLQNWQSRILKSWRRDKKSQTNLPIKPNK